MPAYDNTVQRPRLDQQDQQGNFQISSLHCLRCRSPGAGTRAGRDVHVNLSNRCSSRLYNKAFSHTHTVSGSSSTSLKSSSGTGQMPTVPGTDKMPPRQQDRGRHWERASSSSKSYRDIPVHRQIKSYREQGRCVRSSSLTERRTLQLSNKDRYSQVQFVNRLFTHPLLCFSQLRIDSRGHRSS